MFLCIWYVEKEGKMQLLFPTHCLVMDHEGGWGEGFTTGRRGHPPIGPEYASYL